MWPLTFCGQRHRIKYIREKRHPLPSEMQNIDIGFPFGWSKSLIKENIFLDALKIERKESNFCP